ncbi:hypothetical protein [Candidatus Hodgkinia cicadicola]|uniref:hypothetical protein n=1 Tax=Candidatus Hodgkinia cicadicola TaxID=573658 RepID=UPI0011BAC942
MYLVNGININVPCLHQAKWSYVTYLILVIPSTVYLIKRRNIWVVPDDIRVPMLGWSLRL